MYNFFRKYLYMKVV